MKKFWSKIQGEVAFHLIILLGCCFFDFIFRYFGVNVEVPYLIAGSLFSASPSWLRHLFFRAPLKKNPNEFKNNFFAILMIIGLSINAYLVSVGLNCLACIL